MTNWYPGLAGIDDKGFGGSRDGMSIDGAVIHHTANGGGASALGYVANPNSRDSHPTYLVQSSGASFGIVHPDRRPYSTGGRPDQAAISLEVDNSGGAPNWPTSAAAKETVAQIIAYHYRNSRRWGGGIARNIPGVEQPEFFVAWHSQYVATACPGPDMLAHIDAIIARAMQIAHPAQPPIDPNVTVEPGRVVGVKASFPVYSTASAARAGSPAKATYPAGNYSVYKVDKGDAVNLTDTAGKPGGWAMIAKLGLTPPTTPPAPPEPPAPVLYRVVFDDTPEDPTSDYSSVQVEKGQKVAAPAVEPVRSGFDFLGWFDLNGSQTVPYDFNKPVSGLLTLIAKFEAVTPEPEPEPPADWSDELGQISDNVEAAYGNAHAPLAGLFAGNNAARKRTYLIYAGTTLLISFGPDVVVANVLADNIVPLFVAYVSLASSILLKLGTALGFVAASNTNR